MPTPTNNRQSYNFIDGIKDPAMKNCLITIIGQINALRGVEVAGPFRADIDHGGNKGINAADPEDAQDLVTLGYADANYGAAAMQAALSTGGSHPLSLQTLPGSGTTSGGEGILYGTHAQRVVISTSTLDDGVLWYETDRTVWFQIRQVVGVATWCYAGGIQYGTLSPDTKPTLNTNDAGYLFGSTDFNRQYKWSGSAWADVPGSQQRGWIMHIPYSLHADFQPGAGWALCDGTAGVTRSTPTGGTTTVTVPNMTGANRFLRAVSGATGGVGGAANTHTHGIDPPATASGNPNEAGVVVAAGVGATVPRESHTHTVDIAAFASGAPGGTGGDDGLPPYYEARPYIRL